MQKIYAFLAFVTLGLLAVGEASAASLLTTDMGTAISTGFTDFKDTVIAVLTQAFPFIMGIIGVLAAPSLVKKMISLARGR